MGRKVPTQYLEVVYSEVQKLTEARLSQLEKKPVFITVPVCIAVLYYFFFVVKFTSPQVTVNYIPDLYAALVGKAKDGSLISAKTSVIEDVNTHVNIDISVWHYFSSIL